MADHGMLLDRFNAETAAVIAWRVGAAALAMIVLAIALRVGAAMRKGQSRAAVA